MTTTYIERIGVCLSSWVIVSAVHARGLWEMEWDPMPAARHACVFRDPKAPEQCFVAVFQGVGGPDGRPIGTVEFHDLKVLEIQSGKVRFHHRFHTLPVSTHGVLAAGDGVLLTSSGRALLVGVFGEARKPTTKLIEPPVDGLSLTYSGSSMILFAEESSSHPTTLYTYDVRRGAMSERAHDEPCKAVTAVGESFVVLTPSTLQAYSVLGLEPRWSKPIASGEELATLSSEDPRVVVTTRPAEDERCDLVMRDQKTGAILGEVSLPRRPLAGQWGGLGGWAYAVTYDRQSQVADWGVWNVQGERLGRGTLHLLRDGGFGAVADPTSNGVVLIGTMDRAILLRPDAPPKEITRLPGPPFALGDGILLCNAEKRLIAVKVIE